MKKPTVFGKYLLLERINVGGMAEVFIAKAFGVEGFERILAIKKILPTMAEDNEFITMFIDEARISVQLNHANIVHIHELGKFDAHYFIAMEYVAGKDIRALLEQYRRRREIMPTAQAVYIASKMCEGLDHAHRKRDARGLELGIIHRDISPQNILISFEGEVKIIDFGIAKAANRSQKTQAGILKGKFGYMSPEQVRGMPIDRRSDVFAVGVILYEMLTGEKLFVGESDFSTLEKVRNAEVALPSEFNPNIPEGLERVVLKALAREPEDRYQWASDLQEDLMRFLLAGDHIYSAKHLSAFLTEAFSEDVAREAERMERYSVMERPEELEISGVITSLSRAPRKSVGRAAPPLDATAIGAPPVHIPPPSPAELAELGTPDRTQLVSEDLALDAPDGKTTIASVEQFEKQGEVRRAHPQVVIGDASTAYSGDTVIGVLPAQTRDDVSQVSVSTRDERVVAGPKDWEDPPIELDPDQATRMIPADLRDGGSGQHDRWSDVRTPPVTTDSAVSPGGGEPSGAADEAVTGAFDQPNLAVLHRARAALGGLPAKQRRLLVGGAGGLLIIAVIALLAVLSGDPEPSEDVAVTPSVAPQITAETPAAAAARRRSQPDPAPEAPPGEPVVGAPPEVEPEADEESQKAPGTFTARFVSEVNGVQIKLGEQVVGTTPDARAADLEVGATYRYTASAAGYQAAKGEFSSKEAAEIEVEVKLVKAPPHGRESPRRSASRQRTVAAKGRATGTLACSTHPAGAQVWVDGKFTGRETPIAQGSPLVLPVGNRVIRFKMGDKESAPRMIEVREGELTKLVGVPLE